MREFLFAGAVVSIGLCLGLVGWWLRLALRLRRLEGARRQAQQPAEVSALPPKGSLIKDVGDADIEAQIRRGSLLDAITLYREKTGAGHQEARAAVEAWRDRLRAS
jgi:hypothetical protein